MAKPIVTIRVLQGTGENLPIIVTDGNGLVILSTNYGSLINGELNLAILAECNNIIAQGSNVIISDTPPLSPSEGQIWLDTSI